MEILYLSVLTSQATLKGIHLRDPKFSAFAVHKFNRLVAEGIVSNGHKLVALSTFYPPSGISNKIRKETENDIEFRYINAPTISFLRHIWISVYCFFFVFFWGFSKKKEKSIVADVLAQSACIGGILAAKVIGLRRVGIVTDLPTALLNKLSNKNTVDLEREFSLRERLKYGYLFGFSHYVFLTEQMNDLINVDKKPYIVMEGLVDTNNASSFKTNKNKKKVVIYAGGIYEKYGLKYLVEGFINANVEDAELWIYGSGPFAESLVNYQQNDSRVIYKGVCSNEEVVLAEQQATLLVNPRPSHEEFTKYSFPSKNMEYMLSGTPVLTTQLPGMPSEYYPYVFLFDEGENANGYAITLKNVLSLPDTALLQKGLEARQWVLANKNKAIQSSRIIDLIKK